MKTIIHVNQHVIKSNRKHGKLDPPITVKTYKGTTYAYGVKGPGWELKYSPAKPLPCGAHIWLELDSKETSISLVTDAPTGASQSPSCKDAAVIC